LIKEDEKDDIITKACHPVHDRHFYAESEQVINEGIDGLHFMGEYMARV
jgi:hypothetical protein